MIFRISSVVTAFIVFTVSQAFKFHSRVRVFRGKNYYSSMNNETTSSSFLGITPSGLDQKYWQQQLGPSNSVGIIPTGPEGLNGNGIGSQPKALSRSYRSPDTLRYFKMIESLAPHELLLKFAKSAPANIQEAAKSTVLNILGSMPNYALVAVLITTNKKLANLLYQMQITGYMFKNAEYRMSLTRMLKGLPKLPLATVISQGNISFNPLQSKISGEIEVMTSTGEKGIIFIQTQLFDFLISN